MQKERGIPPVRRPKYVNTGLEPARPHLLMRRPAQAGNLPVLSPRHHQRQRQQKYGAPTQEFARLKGAHQRN